MPSNSDESLSSKIQERSKPGRRFDRLVEATNTLVVGLDSEGFCTLFNRRCEELTGYSRREVLGKQLLPLVIPQDELADVTQRFKKQRKGELPASTQVVPWITKSGETRIIRWSNTFITDETGKVEELFGLGIDITDEVKAKAELEKSEHRYRTLYENLAEGFLIINPQGVISTVNKATAQIFGFAPEEIVNKPFMDFIHPDDRGHATELFQQAIATKTTSPNGWSFRGIHKDGSIIEFQVINSVIRAEGEVKGIHSVIRDITSEKQMLRALKESEDKFRTIAEQSIQGIVIFVDGQIAFANQAVAEITGYSFEELQALSIDQVQAIIHEKDRQHVWRRFQKRLTGEPVQPSYQARIVRKDGEVRWIEVLSHRIQYQGKSAVQAAIIDISEQKRAEIAHRESEEKYRTLVEQSLEGKVITKGFPPRIVFVNTAAGKIMGYLPSELAELSPDQVTAILIPDDREEVLNRIPALLAGNTPHAREIQVTRKDGSQIWLRVVGNRIQYEGEPALQFVFLDITESKEVQIALEESEERYRTLVETSPDAITLTDLEGNIIIANEQALRLNGVESIEELKGINAFNLIAPEDRPRALLNLQKTLRNGSITNVEYTMLRRDGSRFPAELSAAVLRNINGEPQGFIGTTRDISQRKKVEAQYRSLFNGVPVGVFRSTPNGDILEANTALLDMLGYETLEAIQTRKAGDFYLHPDGRKRWERLIAKQEVVRAFVVQFKRKNGEIIWVELNARAVTDNDGHVLYYEGTLEDVTERKYAEIEAEGARKRAEFLVDLMAHDLNNINQGIMLSLEMLESSGMLPDELHDVVSASLAQVERSAELISNVRRFQNLDVEPQQLGIRDLGPPFHAAVQAVERAFPNKQLLLSTNIQEKQFRVYADGFLTELFFNILHNAMKMDRKKLVKIEARAETSLNNGFVEVHIMDHGPGLPDSEKHRIFRRYKDALEGVRGSGIGLTLVQQIINRYGGKIRVEDRVLGDHTQGADFIVSLPRGDDE